MEFTSATNLRIILTVTAPIIFCYPCLSFEGNYVHVTQQVSY